MKNFIILRQNTQSNILILLLLCLPILILGQTNLCEPTTYGYSMNQPDPCDIKSSTYPIDLYMIRVGYYSKPITPYSDCILLHISNNCYYYYAPEGKLLWEYEEAKRTAKQLRDKGIYCKAYVIKNFLNAYGYKRRELN